MVWCDAHVDVVNWQALFVRELSTVAGDIHIALGHENMTIWLLVRAEDNLVMRHVSRPSHTHTHIYTHCHTGCHSAFWRKAQTRSKSVDPSVFSTRACLSRTCRRLRGTRLPGTGITLPSSMTTFFPAPGVRLELEVDDAREGAGVVFGAASTGERPCDVGMDLAFG